MNFVHLVCEEDAPLCERASEHAALHFSVDDASHGENILPPALPANARREAAHGERCEATAP
jgi:hypothetical protein